MNKVLIVVDMQNDFVTGVLGTKEARVIVPNIQKKIKEYKDRGDQAIFTMDTHGKKYMDSLEGKYLPVPHCIKHTEGWKFISELYMEDCKKILKYTFGFRNWKRFIDEDVTEIELCGVCTDICVVSNALILRAIYPDMVIKVDASCCAGVTPEKHKAALETMKSCQIDVYGE